MLKNKDHSFRTAYSVTELSIMMLVISLLLALVYKGFDLVKTARLNIAKTSTQNSPVMVIPDLSIWYDVTNDKSLKDIEESDGSAVTVWNDVNVQNLDKTNLVAYDVGGPTYSESGINGLPALKFNNNFSNDKGQCLVKTNVSGEKLFNRDQGTVFMVVKYMGGGSENMIFGWSATPGGAPRYSAFYFLPFQKFYYEYMGTTSCCAERSSFTYSLNQIQNIPKILTFERSPTAANVYINGAASDTRATTEILSTSTISNLYIGCGVEGPPNHKDNSFNGYIGEIIFFTRTLKTSERKEVEKYLSTKWQITVS